MKTFPATHHFGILTVLLTLVPLVSAAGESNPAFIFCPIAAAQESVP